MEVEGKPWVVADHDGELRNGGQVEDSHDGHEVVAAAPVHLKINEDVSEIDLEKAKTMVQEWRA